MGKETILDKAKSILSGLSFRLFLFLNNLTEDEYFKQIGAQEKKDTFVDFTNRRLGWSLLNFGYALEVEKICNHLLEEVAEARKSPEDIFEWVDIIFLALDGAGRQGFSGKKILNAMHEKLDINSARYWTEGKGDNPHHHVAASRICPQCDPKVEGVCPDTTCERFTG